MKNGRKIKFLIYALTLMGGLAWGLSVQAAFCCPPDSPKVVGCDKDCQVYNDKGDCGECNDIDSTYCNCKNFSINCLSWNGDTPVCTCYQSNIVKQNCRGLPDGCPCCVICNNDNDCTSFKGGPRCAFAGSELATCRCNDHSDCSDPYCRCEDTTGAGVKRCIRCPISGQTCCGGECCPSGRCHDV